MSIIDTVRANLSDAQIQEISQQIGADPSTTKQAVDAALPALVGGMAGTASDPDGASGIQSLFGSHGGGVLGNLGGLIAAAGGAGGGGILGQILGQHQPAVEDATKQASGLDGGQVKKLLMILGPIILAALARKHAASAATPSGSPGSVGDVLAQETRNEQARNSSPHIGGLLGKILSHVESRPQ